MYTIFWYNEKTDPVGDDNATWATAERTTKYCLLSIISLQSVDRQIYVKVKNYLANHIALTQVIYSKALIYSHIFFQNHKVPWKVVNDFVNKIVVFAQAANKSEIDMSNIKC